MKNCLICDTSLPLDSSFCHNCCWPIGALEAIGDPGLQKAALEWVSKKYRETQHKNGIPAIARSASKISEQIDSVQNIELFKSDLAKLMLRIEGIENRQFEADEKINDSFQLEPINQSIESIQKAITNFVKQQINKNQEFENLIQFNQKTMEDYMKRSSMEGKQQVEDISSIKSILTSRYANKLTTSVVPLNSSVIASNELDLGFVPEELDLLRDYNGNSQELPNLLREQATNVSIDDEAFTRLRNGDESNIAFKPDRKGNYLVIFRGGYRYLLPNRQPRIITQIYAVTKAIYKCDGYSESYRDFRLIKPALVLEESINRWKLSRKGILEFI
jgi:hypothetical protein